MDEKRKRIGIMGGTFDPIHYGHLLIAENAAVQYALDQVLFIPTGHSPHKAEQHITDAKHRCNMIRLAIADNPSFSLSTMEVTSEATSYTYRTLERLTECHPDEDFYFILGGDSLKDFESWRYPDRILKAAYILAAVRDDMAGEDFFGQIAHLNERCEAPRVFPLSTPNFSVSSRKIRELVQNQKTIRYMLPEIVRNYILENNLYMEELTK